MMMIVTYCTQTLLTQTLYLLYVYYEYYEYLIQVTLTLHLLKVHLQALH